jgi:hypothetical protein
MIYDSQKMKSKIVNEIFNSASNSQLDIKDCDILLYKGIQASSDEFSTNFNDLYNSSSGDYYLGQIESLDLLLTNTTIYYSVGDSISTSISQSGIATWGVISLQTKVEMNVNNPYGMGWYNNIKNHIIIPISDINGNGVLKLTDVNLVQGGTVSIADFSLSIDMGE